MLLPFVFEVLERLSSMERLSSYLQPKSPPPAASQDLESASCHSRFAVAAVQTSWPSRSKINTGKRKTRKIRNSEFVFQSVAVVPLNKYLLWNVKGSSWLWFSIVIMFLLFGLSDPSLPNAFSPSTAEDEFRVVSVSGGFSESELCCETFVWLRDLCNKSRKQKNGWPGSWSYQSAALTRV